MTNPEKILQTWTTLKQLIISAKDNCKQKLAECKEHGQQLEVKINELKAENNELIENLNKDWTEIYEYFNGNDKINWIINGFTYEKVKVLLESKLIESYQYDFAIWLKDTKQQKVSSLTKEQLIQLAREWITPKRASKRSYV